MGKEKQKLSIYLSSGDSEEKPDGAKETRGEAGEVGRNKKNPL